MSRLLFSGSSVFRVGLFNETRRALSLSVVLVDEYILTRDLQEGSNGGRRGGWVYSFLSEQTCIRLTTAYGILLYRLFLSSLHGQRHLNGHRTGFSPGLRGELQEMMMLGGGRYSMLAYWLN